MLDFVANVEDEFDILITMNQQAEIETVGQLVDAVGQAPDRLMSDLFSKFDALIAQREALLVDRGQRPVRPGHGEGALADPRDLQRQARRSCSAPIIIWA